MTEERQHEVNQLAILLAVELSRAILQLNLNQEERAYLVNFLGSSMVKAAKAAENESEGHA